MRLPFFFFHPPGLLCHRQGPSGPVGWRNKREEKRAVAAGSGLDVAMAPRQEFLLALQSPFLFMLWFHLPRLVGDLLVASQIYSDRRCGHRTLINFLTNRPKLQHPSQCLALQSHCLGSPHIYPYLTIVSQILLETFLGLLAEAANNFPT